MYVYKWRYDHSDAFAALSVPPHVADQIGAAVRDGRSLRSLWKPTPVHIDRDSDQQVLPDISSFPTPAFAKSCHAALAPLFPDGSAEWLDLLTSEGPYYALHVLWRTAALVESRSVVQRLPSGMVTNIKRHTFDPAALQLGPPVFRLAQWPSGPIYCDQRFADVLEEDGYTGLVLQPVWSAETGPILG